MSWFKVDDEVHGSLKRLQASTAAMGLWAMAGSWSRKRKTAGFVPRTALRVIAPDLSDEQASALAAELVEAKVDGIHEHGLWLPLANGWQFHEWEERNPADDVEAERSANLSEIRRQAGLRGAQARWSKPRTGEEGKNGFATFANGNTDPAHACALGSPSGSDPVSSGKDVADPDQTQPDPSEPLENLTGSAREGEKKSPFRTENERHAFELWEKKVWRKLHPEGTARATPKRVTPIRARLREGATLEQFSRACDAVAASTWHLGENDSGKAYIEPGTLFRNREKFEEWLTVRAAKPPGAADHERQQAAENARLIDQAKRGEYGDRTQQLAAEGRLVGDVLKRFKEAIRTGNLKRRLPELRPDRDPVSSPRATADDAIPPGAVTSLLGGIGRPMP